MMLLILVLHFVTNPYPSDLQGFLIEWSIVASIANIKDEEGKPLLDCTVRKNIIISQLPVPTIGG